MEINKEAEEKIEELQNLERNLHNIIAQKQTIQVDLNQAITAHEEVKNSDDDLFKTVGDILIKTDKASLLKDLEEKKRVLDLRVKSVEKQEKSIESRVNELKEEINKLIFNKK